jgi:ParB family transcriptional regulator, chromosome partitioning protein
MAATTSKRKATAPYREMKLGQGLDALFGETPNEPKEEQSIALDLIQLPAQQPRRYFDPEAMKSLVESVRRDGVLEPLLVRSLETGGYELVAGERRYRASKEVGLKSVPVVIRQMSDEQALHITLVENLLREDLNPLEETEGILQLLALRLKTDVDAAVSLLYRMQNDVQRLTHNVMGQPESEVVQAVFTEVGVAWESFVNNRLPLLKLPDDILGALRGGQIAYTKAQAIARVKDESKRKKLLKQVVTKDLSVAQIRDQVKQLNTVQEEENSEPSFRMRVDDVFRRVKQAKIWDDPKKQRKLEKALADLEGLLE